MGILLDTGFFFALKIKKDKNHENSKNILKKLLNEKYKNIITTDLVINETYSLVNLRTKNNKSVIEKFHKLFWGDERFFNIIEIEMHEYKFIADIMNKYSTPKRILSFVDASLIFIGKKFKYNIIISFDEHFDGIFQRIFT